MSSRKPIFRRATKAKSLSRSGAPKQQYKGTAALERGLSVLSVFTDEAPFLTLADLSRKTGLNKATLLRLLHSLEALRFVGPREDGHYHVGPIAFRLGRLYQASIGEAALIGKSLQRLAEITGESASFMVREGDARICVYRVNSKYQIRDHVEIGDVRPLGRGAPGKILAAFSDASAGPSYRQIRADFFCVSRAEIERDAAGAASPVFRDNGLAGALAVTGPINRMDKLGERKLRNVLLREAIDLTVHLGGTAARMQDALEVHDGVKA
jgi:DNA-binding IclR family transcriptional regulator